MKICISIGVYDAFDDVHISASIIRNNWNSEHDLFIIAGLSKQNTNSLIDSNLIDCAIDIPTPNTDYLADDQGGINGRAARSTRVLNSIYLTGKKAIQEDCDYIFHLNAGSWVLQPDEINRLIKELDNKTFAVGVANRHKYLMFDDHFLLVNLHKACFYQIYDIDYHSRPFNPISMSINEIHGMLATWISMVPYGEVYVHTNHELSVNQFGKVPYTFNPLIFNKSYKFLHSNKSFPEILFLRQKYIDMFVDKLSSTIEVYLDENYSVPDGCEYNCESFPYYARKCQESIMWKAEFKSYDKKLLK